MRMGRFFDCEWFCHAWFAYTDASCSLKMAQLCLITTIPPSLRPLCHDLGHIASQSFSRSRMTKQVEQIRMWERRSRRGHEFSHLSLHVVWLAPTMLLLPDRPSSYRCHPTLVAQPHQKASGRSGEHGRTNTTRATRRRVTSLFGMHLLCSSGMDQF